MEQFIRICLECNHEILYKSKQGFEKANQKNTLCKACNVKGDRNPFYGKHHTNEYKDYASQNRKESGKYDGERNPMYGKSIYDVWLKKYGKEVADQKQKQADEKNRLSNLGVKNGFYGKVHNETLKNKFSKSRMGKNNPHYGKKHSENWKLVARERTIQRLKLETNGKIGYNPTSCQFLSKLNEENNWKLQHAENGGEIEICGFLLDGYDKERNIVVEYDEPLHDKPYRKKKDIERMNIIINELKCQFYRFNEKTKTLTRYA